MDGAGDLENKANSAHWGLTELGKTSLVYPELNKFEHTGVVLLFARKLDH